MIRAEEIPTHDSVECLHEASLRQGHSQGTLDLERRSALKTSSICSLVVVAALVLVVDLVEALVSLSLR